MSTTPTRPKRPSRTTKTYWLEAHSDHGYPEHTLRGGKWLIFIDEKVDEAWARIVEALEAGRLGSTAKVSTAKPSQSSTEAAFVICVYTSSNDEADVWRVRDGLRAAGFEMRLGWKSDDATRRVVGDRVHKPSEVYTFMDEA